MKNKKKGKHRTLCESEGWDSRHKISKEVERRIGHACLSGKAFFSQATRF